MKKVTPLSKIRINESTPDNQSVHISQIKAGDTVLHNGEVKTVSGTDIKQDKFMGTTLFGDSYLLGNKKVTKVDPASITKQNRVDESSKIRIDERSVEKADAIIDSHFESGSYSLSIWVYTEKAVDIYSDKELFKTSDVWTGQGKYWSMLYDYLNATHKSKGLTKKMGKNSDVCVAIPKATSQKMMKFLETKGFEHDVMSVTEVDRFDKDMTVPELKDFLREFASTMVS